MTPSGSITEFDANCQYCILTDIVQGPADILYVTSNNPILLRFNVATGTFLAPIDIPNSNAVGGDLAAHGDDIWFTDFNNDSLWRYDITPGNSPSSPSIQPSDVAVDSLGRVWFTAPFDDTVNQLDPATGTVVSFQIREGSSRGRLAIATDGQIWFTSRFVPQGVGRLDPTTGVVTTFPTPSNPGPEDIAASPDGSIWFTQTTKGNIARINNAVSSPRPRRSRAANRSGSPSPPTATRGTR